MESEINDHQIYVHAFCFMKINILIAFWGQKCLMMHCHSIHAMHGLVKKEKK